MNRAAGARRSGTRARLHRFACVIVAALAAILSLARPAAAGGDGFDQGSDEIGLWPAGAMLESLQRAHATVPSERALDAWQRYLLAWLDASEAIGPERANVQRAQQQREYRVYEPDDSYAARKALDHHAAELEEQLEDALLSSLADASPPEGRAAIDVVRRERKLGRAMAQAEGVASSIAFETIGLEKAIADALRSRPVDRAAALAALERTRDERIAAATALVQAAAAGERAERALWVANGLHLLTSADWMAIDARRAERAHADGAATLPDAASAAAPAGHVDAAQAAADDRVMAVFERTAGHRPARRANADLLEAQWRSLRAAADAVAPEARLAVARIATRAILDPYDRSPAAMDIVVSMCQPGVDPACAVCLRAALPAWRIEWPAVFLRTGDSAVRAVVAAWRRDVDSTDGDDDGFGEYAGVLDAWREQLARESSALERRVCAACASGCLRVSDDESTVHGSIAAARDLPEVADDTDMWESLGFTLDDHAPDAADDPAMEPNPFALGTAGEPTVVGLPLDADWLRTMLSQRGFGPEALATCQPVLEQAAGHWDASVLPAAREAQRTIDAPLLRFDGIPSAFDEARASRIQSALARARDAARAADDDAVAAIVATLGLGPDDASMLRLARRLGEQRRERAPFHAGESPAGALRVNVSSAVLATELSADARASVTPIVLRHAADLEAKLAEFRRISVDAELSSFRARARLQQERADPSRRDARLECERAYRAEVRSQQARSAAAQQANDAAERAAIDEILAAVPAADALAFRGTVNRRRYPDVLFGHEMFLKVVSSLLGQMPPEDEAARARLARAADAWVDASNENLARELGHRESLGGAAAGPGAARARPSPDTAARESVRACSLARAALLSLAVERLADACPERLLRISKEFAEFMRYYGHGSFFMSESDMKNLLRRHGLDSAP